MQKDGRVSLSDGEKAAAEEIRLRAGRPLSVLLPAGELPLEALVEPEDLETLCDIATEFSRYAAAVSSSLLCISPHRFSMMLW